MSKEKRPVYFRAVSVLEALPRLPINDLSATSVACTGYIDDIGFAPVRFYPAKMEFKLDIGTDKRKVKVMYLLVPMDEEKLTSMVIADINRKLKQEELRAQADREFDERVSNSIEENKTEDDGKEA